jgi:hypothetical protein
MMAESQFPSDLQMTTPDPSLPKELTVFWGKWSGGVFVKQGYNKIIIIVEQIDDNKARLYCNFGIKGTSHAWMRFWAKVKLNDGVYELFYHTKDGRRQSLSMNKFGNLVFNPEPGSSSSRSPLDCIYELKRID